MYYQTGSMRDINNDSSPFKNSVVYDRENQFQYAQRSKYEKSQASYIQHQKHKPIFEQQKTSRMLKTQQNKQMFYYVPIKIKSIDREDYINIFKIQLLNVFQKNNNCIIIHITNDNDSLFLWTFYIRDSQFLNLKNQQSLKIDFHGFPEVIETFLNCCVKNQKQAAQNKTATQFFTVLDIKKGNEEAQFKILQGNKFKQSLHLSLKFKKANDEQLKIFLSQKFDKQRKQNQKISSQLSQAQYQLNSRIQKLQKLHIQYQQMQKQKNQKIWQLQRRQKQKIKQVKLSLEQQNMKKQKYQNQKNIRYISQLNEKIQQLKNKNQEMLANYQKANQRLINLQASESSLKSKCSILEQQCQMYQKNNKQLKAKQLKNNQQYHTLRNENTKLTCTIQSLQDKIKQKQKRLSQNIQVKSNNFNQISTLQQNLRQQKQKVAKLQEKNDSLQLQITKIQNKYQDLFNKYQKKKDKIGDYNQILTLQQQQIQSRKKQQRKILEEITEIKRQKQKLQFDLKNRDNKIRQLKDHIEQSQHHIDDQKKIISDLNKRLNQKSIGVKSYGIPSTLPTYTGVYNPTIGRQFSSTLSSTQSRVKYSPSPISTSPLNQRVPQKIAPPFKKYKQGIENDKDQQNSHSYHSHSRSPIANKLSQQPDPEEGDRTKEKIGPIKFKK